jgi:hypothetical protein
MCCAVTGSRRIGNRAQIQARLSAWIDFKKRSGGLGSAISRFAVRMLFILAAIACWSGAGTAQTGADRISGTVLDPSGRPVAGARVEFDSATGARGNAASCTSGGDGHFSLLLPAGGGYTVRVEAAGFAAVAQKIDFNAAASAAGASLTLRLQRVTGTAERVIVTADVSEIAVDSPDPSQKVMVREELLDANPGRPGAPLSLPGLPIETASGGIKAPQYFVPGVAGDHGEPIAQYIAVGGYLLPNDLSANAHGNGYADPNIYVSGVLGSVETDGGAFSVLEGNHALNLAATYSLRPHLRRFLTLTGDYRDMDLTAGFAPANSAKREWVAVEANYGNGLLKFLEHRQQYKWNAMRIFDPGRHEITLLSIGYFGISHEGNLVPLGLGAQLNDTVDPRQKDQTHTAILAANDIWKVKSGDVLSFAGFMRSYNLTLFSDFGEGLIRQSEFRTVEGGEVRATHTIRAFVQGSGQEAMIGASYNEDDIHRDNLDHYLSGNAMVYGPFLKVLANDITIRDVAPYAALHGDLGRHLRFYTGLRHDQIEIKNTDRMNPVNSFDDWAGFESPKATLAWTPGDGAAHWLPSASLSIGQAYFTEDPRISVASSSAVNPPTSAFMPGETPRRNGASPSASGSAALASPLERSHSEQLVLDKEFSATDVRVTLGRTTTMATLAKIDPDTGLAEDLGPGKLNFLTASARHQFTSLGTLQVIFSKADARLVPTSTTPGQITPEAPRTIFDALATLDRLPLGLHARGEYEYVGHKQLDVGGFEAIPVGETRLAAVRPFLNGRLEMGTNGMIARGYTGQTTETFAPGWVMGTIPNCSGGVHGIANDFDCGTVEHSVGIRMVSWVGGSVSWRFGEGK